MNRVILSGFCFVVACMTGVSQAQTTLHYDESVDGDLSQSPPGPSFDMVVGVNEWRGVLEPTAPSQNDIFTAVLPDGLAITRVQMTGPASNANFTGFMRIAGGNIFEETSTGSVDRTYDPGETPSSVEVTFTTDFNISNKNWTVLITVAAIGGTDCGNGVTDAGEECDDGNTDDGDCCSSTCTWEAAGSACGDATTECSGQDTCDGAGACQANDLAAGEPCGDAGSECVNQDTCDGAGACTDGGFAAADTPCGDAATECSGQDTCDGAGACQANDLAAGEPCGDAGSDCVNQDTCDGAGACADNGFAAAGTACGDPKETACNSADACDGAGVCDENLAADGTACDDGDTCTTVDACSAGLCVGGPDETAPTIDCSAIDPLRTTDPGVCTFTMPGAGFDATFDDNCGDARLSHDYAAAPETATLAGATFPDGVTTVVWTVTDSVGATADCTVDIVISDGEVPTITCPADLEAEPTGPDGANVSYDPLTVEDNCPGATAACVPASGGLFAIGDTPVACMATDGAGNTAECSFTVTVLTPEEVIQNLIDDVQALADAGTVNHGQAQSLAVKLQQVLIRLGRDQTHAGCNVLNAFMNAVNAFINGGMLTADEAQPLIDSANNTRAALGCVGAATAASKHNRSGRK